MNVTPPPHRRIPRLETAMLALVGVFPLGFLCVALARIAFPFELEWMEGTSWLAARRIMSGHRLYVRPTLLWAPQFYTPLYFYAAQPFIRLMGFGFTPLRLLSILSTLGSFLVLFLYVRRETADGRAAWVAACLYAAYYGATQAWYDLARIDSLLIVLGLMAVYAIRFGGPWAGPVASAALITLAYLTKQITIVWFLTLPPAVFLLHRRRGVVFGGCIVLFMLIALVAAQIYHDGWWLYYVQKLPVAQPTDAEYIFKFWVYDVVRFSPFAMFLIILALRGLRREGARESLLFHGGFLAGGVLSGWLARLNIGGDVNVLMPMHATFALLFGLAYHRLSDLWRGGSADPRARWALALIFAQFAILAYNPLRFIPRERDKEAYQALADRIASIPGEVYVPFHIYLEKPGGPPHIHAIALADVVRGDGAGEGRRLRQEIGPALRQARFDAVITGGPEKFYEPDLETGYEKVESLFSEWPDVAPRSGYPIRPTGLYLPRDAEK